MDKERSEFVSIYCKILPDKFSDEMICREATGKEIYDFLMTDAGQYFDENSNPLPGDANIWYLGANDGFGNLVYKFMSWSWGFGQASFEIVKKFIQAIYDDRLFMEEQFQNLMAKIEEGHQIKDMYAIGNHLYRMKNELNRKEKANYAV